MIILTSFSPTAVWAIGIIYIYKKNKKNLVILDALEVIHLSRFQ